MNDNTIILQKIVLFSLLGDGCEGGGVVGNLCARPPLGEPQPTLPSVAREETNRNGNLYDWSLWRHMAERSESAFGKKCG